MSSKKSRHLAMQAIVRGSPLYGSQPDMNHVESEIEELGRCNRLNPINRQRLLQVIHASRALDTCLRTILSSNGITPASGIGKMLHQLKLIHPGTRGHISHSLAVSFSSSIAHVRNKYAHRAGSFPTSTYEVDKVISEIQACLATIL